MNPDFRDMLFALSAEKAEYLLVGAYALAAHGYPRATGDIDLWVKRSEENSQCVWKALQQFGAPLRGLCIDDLQTPDIVFQIGTAPRRIDILTSISGVEFDEAWKDRKMITLDGLELSIISRRLLLKNKKAAGRPKDIGDIAWLESHPEQ